MTSSPEGATNWTLLDLDGGGGTPAPAASTAVTSFLPRELGAAAPRERTPLETSEQRGFEAGLHEGASRARQDLDPAVAMLSMLLSDLAETGRAFARDRERNLEALAMAVARRIVQRELTVDPETVRVLIARALELLPLDTEILVRVNPADLEQLGARRVEVAPGGRDVTLRWLADPALDRGSFTLEAPERMVDGRVDSALREVYERLEDAPAARAGDEQAPR